ncbi:hypothetical protein NADE_002598 [Nannochloris sp. 'desiccata']|nr:hypothetical protein KSW81_005686 [Chlorella desiccata (nom. nud.)]KAH7623409.1 hypothetical protein NADE_002598 [Chlorella desiccata (nom. nud.)]
MDSCLVKSPIWGPSVAFRTRTSTQGTAPLLLGHHAPCISAVALTSPHRFSVIRSRALPPELAPYVVQSEQPESWVLETLSNIPILPLQLTITAVAAYLAAAWPLRPRGWSRTDLIEVRDSQVQGKGIFATENIPENTILGAYPGRPRTSAEMLTKCQTAPLARYYCFRNKNGYFLDPTDWTGAPCKVPVPGLPWLPIDSSLSYANEPPKSSSGVNVTVEDDPKDEQGLVFVSICNIPAGAEVFVDYGLDYDRSSYGSSSSPKSANRNGGGTGGGTGGKSSRDDY